MLVLQLELSEDKKVCLYIIISADWSDCGHTNDSLTLIKCGSFVVHVVVSPFIMRFMFGRQR